MCMRWTCGSGTLGGAGLTRNWSRISQAPMLCHHKKCLYQKQACAQACSHHHFFVLICCLLVEGAGYICPFLLQLALLAEAQPAQAVTATRWIMDISDLVHTRYGISQELKRHNYRELTQFSGWGLKNPHCRPLFFKFFLQFKEKDWPGTFAI